MGLDLLSRPGWLSRELQDPVAPFPVQVFYPCATTLDSFMSVLGRRLVGPDVYTASALSAKGPLSQPIIVHLTLSC